MLFYIRKPLRAAWLLPISYPRQRPLAWSGARERTLEARYGHCRWRHGWFLRRARVRRGRVGGRALAAGRRVTLVGVRNHRHGSWLHRLLADRSRDPRLQVLAAPIRRSGPADAGDQQMAGCAHHDVEQFFLLGLRRREPRARLSTALRPATPLSTSGGPRNWLGSTRSAASSTRRSASSPNIRTRSAAPRTVRSSSGSWLSAGPARLAAARTRTERPRLLRTAFLVPSP